jgi:hypothetical protein
MFNVTGTTFIRNAFDGGFPIFESMAAIMPIVDSFIIVDMGSTDGTLDVCNDIARANSRISIKHEQWSKTNTADTFADIANRCVELCPTQNVLFYQADEIFHENLIKNVRKEYEKGQYGLSFERIQLSHGMHIVKWLPHMVCRSVVKGIHKYVADGMTIGDHSKTKMMCRNPLTGVPGNSRQFPWHNPKPGLFFDAKNPTALNGVMAEVFPWDEFLYDTSSSFRDNQIGKKALHAPFWNESPNVLNGMHKDEWARREAQNLLWTKKEPSFPMPKIALGLVGMAKYTLRPEVLASLKTDKYDIWS